MRHLTEEEIKINERQIRYLKKETKFLKYNIAYGDLMLNQGLEANLEKQKERMSKEREDHKSNLKLTQEKIKELQNQIDNGVEEKKVNE